jgi:SEC-C motif
LADARRDSVARHQALVDRIVPAARNIHAYWLAQRAPWERLRQLNKAPAPGRNDACPCGSGKKFGSQKSALLPAVRIQALWQWPQFLRPFQFFDHTGLTLAPVLVKNLNPVFRFDKAHVSLPK